MPHSRRLGALALVLVLVGCKKTPTESSPPPPPPPAATVQSVTVSPTTATLSSLGETATIVAEVHLSNGTVGNQAVTWTSSAGNVATVSAGTVTAAANGQTTITAAVGSINATASITVAQAVASVRLLPGDTVVKSVGQLRGTALDARNNPVANAALQWQSLTPLIITVDQNGNLTPQSTGVARVRISAGTQTATALVRTVWNVTQLSDLFPLFEYTSTTGQRRAISDVSQTHADARAAVMGPVWDYLTTVLPTSGSNATDMYFTTWPQIWTEFIPFCGGQFLVDQINWTSCANPNRKHFLIPPGQQPNDYAEIVRFLGRQFMVASHTASQQFPWFMEGFTQWLAGGTAQTDGTSGKARVVSINDFKTGDTQATLAPLNDLMHLASADFYANLPQRTPVAVRMAQGVVFVSYLATETQSSALCQVFDAIRATPGAGLSNDGLIQLIVAATGKTVAQLEAGYLAHGRALAGGAAALETIVATGCTA
ncbi:MAG: Ig-like domain-containing protein [Gemmatimonadota bacterium]